ncbi:MAG: hypothetical protein AB9828_06525 [Sphaerochaetaceae bacterium]
MKKDLRASIRRPVDYERDPEWGGNLFPKNRKVIKNPKEIGEKEEIFVDEIEEEHTAKP